MAVTVPLGLSSSTLPQGEQTKPFRTWTKAEANKVLNDSPWAKTQEVSSVFGLGVPTDFKFTLRLRSALPVREALVRLKQIDAHYDQLNEKERATFDSKTKGLLDCLACADNYVLSLSSRSENSPGWDLAFKSYEKMTLAMLRENVFLSNNKGEKRELIHFVPPKAAGDETVFFFARLDGGGKPLIGLEDKKLMFRLNPQDAGSPKNFEFDVAKLIVNGKVEF
jgi:hypothetical protein